MDERVCIAIDLKSFYASVECRERGLDPLDTNLVVADRKRSEKTICLAVSPSMKSLGIPGRCRLFEAEEAVRDFNANRIRKAPGRKFTGSSWSRSELGSNPSLSLDYIAAPPRMALYIDYSTRIYRTYLKYIAPEDIHVYSIDEVFMDVTDYLSSYRLSPEELARTMILDVLNTTGITATAGIGTNLYLAKVAMDIKAKHVNADENGVTRACFSLPLALPLSRSLTRQSYEEDISYPLCKTTGCPHDRARTHCLHRPDGTCGYGVGRCLVPSLGQRRAFYRFCWPGQ